jgi:hypothetical protein
MLTLTLPDSDPTLALDDESAYVQSAPACVTVSV